MSLPPSPSIKTVELVFHVVCIDLFSDKTIRDNELSRWLKRGFSSVFVCLLVFL